MSPDTPTDGVASGFTTVSTDDSTYGFGESELVQWRFGHRARLVLMGEQEALVEAQAHGARALWNLLHNWWLMTPRCKRSLAAADAAIRQARKEIDWLGVLPAQAAQAVLKTYFQAWKNCWDRRAARPDFKTRHRSVMAVDIPQSRDLQITRVHRRWGVVNIPKVGRVRFHWTRDLPVSKRADANNRITGARLIKDTLGWHIAMRVQTMRPAPQPHPGPQVGIDAGITIPLALSDGNHQHHHRPFNCAGRADRDKWLTTSEKARLLRLERQAAHRKSFRTPGERSSRRLRGIYDQIAGLRATAKRRHVDWQHKTTTAIADTYGTVVVEDLNITNMVTSARGTVAEPGRRVAQKAGLNRAITQEAWGRTITMLSYKLALRGGTLVKVGPAGTSQRCSTCRRTTSGSRKTQALFVCKNPGCGWTGNADLNAARNILHRYLMALVDRTTRGGRKGGPAAGRAVVRRAKRDVKPAAVR